MKYHNLLIFINLLIILLFKADVVQGIVGGRMVKQELFRYHVSLVINNAYACGGSIIGSQHVLTAAQCVLNQNGQFLDAKIMVTAGVIDLSSDGISKKVIRAYVPHKFRPLNRTPVNHPFFLEIGDIAVLKLEDHLPVDTESVDVLQLPKAYQKNRYSKYPNRETIFTGFGQDVPIVYASPFDVSNLPNKYNSYKWLKFAKANVNSKLKCTSSYPRFQDEHICASLYQSPVKNSGTCLGDIGGPLVLGGNTVIAVLTQFRSTCDEKYDPALYTRVSSFLPFIDSAISDNHMPDMRIADYTGSMVEKIHPSRMTDFYHKNYK